jgi:putative aminopeptidase FrvX
LPYKLYHRSVQEEIGLRGAQMVAQNIKPNVAILLMFDETSSPCYTSKEGEHIREQVVLLQEHLLFIINYVTNIRCG